MGEVGLRRGVMINPRLPCLGISEPRFSFLFCEIIVKPVDLLYDIFYILIHLQCVLQILFTKHSIHWQDRSKPVADDRRPPTWNPPYSRPEHSSKWGEWVSAGRTDHLWLPLQPVLLLLLHTTGTNYSTGIPHLPSSFHQRHQKGMLFQRQARLLGLP